MARDPAINEGGFYMLRRKKVIRSGFAGWCLLFLGTLSFLFSVTKVEAQEAEEIQKLGKRMTAKQLLVAEIEGLSDRGVEPKTLTNLILERPTEHRNRTQSEAQLKAWVQAQFRSYLTEQLPKVYSQLNQKKEWVSQQALREILDQLEPQVQKTVQQFVSQRFPPIYEEARKQAVESQYTLVRTGFYPAPTDVEAIEQMGQNQREKIEVNLRQNMIGRLVLLEENEGRVQQEIEAVIADALQQIRQQRQLLENATVEGQSDTVIASNLRQAILNLIAELKNQQKDGRRVYPIFPSVEKAIPERAQRLMGERFHAFLSSDLSRFLNAAQIKQSILTNITEHAKKENSLKLLDQQLKPAVQLRVVSEYAANSADTAFQAKLFQLLKADGNIRQTYENQFTEALKRLATQIREEFAQEQMVRFFPEISQGQWIPPEPMILQLVTGQQSDEVDLSSFLNDKPLLLEETAEKLKQAVRSLLNEGKDAYNGQVQLINAHQEGIEIEIAAARERRTKADWVQHYIDVVHSDWEQKRMPDGRTLSSTLVKKYPELFDAIKAAIRRIIDSIFTEQEKKQSQSLTGSTGGQGITGTSTDTTHNKGTGDESGGEPPQSARQYLIPILLLILFLLLLGLAIWYILRQRKKKKEADTHQIPLGGLTLTMLDNGAYRIEGDYYPGRTDQNRSLATLERAITLTI
jgi:cbb3-type cytochrome oxidase subunit 3